MTTSTKSRKAATVTKLVSIIARYAMKVNGLICYKVRSVMKTAKGESQHLYCVTYNPATGKWTCASDEPCKEQTYSKSHTCKHIAACASHEDTYYHDGVRIDSEPVVLDAQEVLAEVEQLISEKQEPIAALVQEFQSEYQLFFPAKEEPVRKELHSCYNCGRMTADYRCYSCGA